MGNENSSNPETPRFFWRSDDDPFSPKSEIIWCPFDRTSSDFLEYEYQSFLKDKTRPPPEINGYIYRFDCWRQDNIGIPPTNGNPKLHSDKD